MFSEQNLATKRDIAELKREIKELDVALRTEIKQLEVALCTEIKQLDDALHTEIKQLDVGLRAEIKQLDVKIEQIRSDLTRDLKELEYRMTIKLGAMLVVAVGVMATLVKLL